MFIWNFKIFFVYTSAPPNSKSWLHPWVGYRYDHTEEYQAKKKSLFLFRYSLNMLGIHPRYGEYQSDTREVKKKKKKKRGGEFDTWMIFDHRSAQLD